MRGLLPDNALLYGAVGIAGLGIIGIARAMRRRRVAEFERQVLELLCLAIARSTAIAPVLRRTAELAPRRERRWLNTISDALDAGRPLSAALAIGAPKCFRPHVLAAIAATEGGGALAEVLHALAREQDCTAALQFRLRLTTVYPALLGALLLAFVWVGPDVRRWAPETLGTRNWGPTIVAIVAIAIWWLLSSRRRWVELVVARTPWIGARLRLLAVARVLRVLAVRVRAGAPLAQALRDTAPAAGNGAVQRDVSAAAGLAHGGARAGEIWARAGLPLFVIARLARAGADSSPESLALGLQAASARCVHVATDAFERGQRRLYLGLLLVFGTAIGMQFSETFGWLEAVRNHAAAQMPW